MTNRPLPDPLFAIGTKLLIVALENGAPHTLRSYGQDERFCPLSVSAGEMYEPRRVISVTSGDVVGTMLFITRAFGGPLTLYAPKEHIHVCEARDGARTVILRDFTSPQLRAGCVILVQDGLVDLRTSEIPSALRRNGPTAIFKYQLFIDGRVRTVIRHLAPSDLEP